MLGRYAIVVDHLAVRNFAQGAPLEGGSTLHPIHILPIITYCCEPLVFAQPHTLEHDQTQALRLKTGAVKTTPIDAMTLITDNKPIQELIEEKAVLQHEKILRISGDQYWKTYVNKPRNLKKQHGFIQKVTEIRTKFEIKTSPTHCTNGETQPTSNKLSVAYNCNKA